MRKFLSFLWRHPVWLIVSFIFLFYILLLFLPYNLSMFLSRNFGFLLPWVLLALFLGWLGKGIGLIYQSRVALFSPQISALLPRIVQIALPFIIIAIIVFFSYKDR